MQAGDYPSELRDLEWVIFSPFLLASTASPDLRQHNETRDLLSNLHKDPSPLLAHLQEPKRHTLGSYFEQLVIFWLSHLPSVTVIATNLQIHANGQTLGEMDLIFNFENKTYHWELSVKFYLNIGNGETETDFVGPLLRDNLGKKLDRLYDHQLNLPQRTEAQDVLATFAAQNISSFPWVKGMLFQPLDQKIAVSLPTRISRNCAIGVWISFENLTASRLPDFERFIIPEKRSWLTHRHQSEEAQSGGTVALSNSVAEKIEVGGRPVLACLLTDTGGPMLEESLRLFVAPNDWQG